MGNDVEDAGDDGDDNDNVEEKKPWNTVTAMIWRKAKTRKENVTCRKYRFAD